VRGLDLPVQLADGVKSLDGGGKAPMQAEDLVIDNGSDWEIVEEVGKNLPHVGSALLLEAFVLEALDLSDLPALVVASQNGKALPVAHLQSDECGHTLHAVESSVDLIAHEELIGVGEEAADFEEFDQVVLLSMHVTADSNWDVHRLHVAFFV